MKKTYTCPKCGNKKAEFDKIGQQAQDLHGTLTSKTGVLLLFPARLRIYRIVPYRKIRRRKQCTRFSYQLKNNY
jgi:hypothetical protein